MISPHNRPNSAFCLTIVLFSLGFVGSCNTTKPDLKEELLRSLKGANVEDYLFAAEEDETQVITSLTNKAVRNLIRLDKGDANQILRYTSVRARNANAAKTYKTELSKTGNALTLLVTDLATGEVASKKTFPAPEAHHKVGTAGPPTFDSLEDCLKDFNCTRRGALQCEANRTCENQFAALTCCLTNGQCLSVHLIIRPTSFRCLLTGFIPDLEGIVLSQL